MPCGALRSSALTQAAPETEGWYCASSWADQRRSQVVSSGRKGAAPGAIGVVVSCDVSSIGSSGAAGVAGPQAV